MKSYDTLTEIITNLRSKGYTFDFNLNTDYLECRNRNLQLKPEAFESDAFFRFEGMSYPDDNSILYAISSKQNIRGLLVEVYGVYAEIVSTEMKLKFNRK